MSITTRISLLFLLIIGSGSWFFLRSEVDDIKKRYREATEEPLVDFATVLASVISNQSSNEIYIGEQLKISLNKDSWKTPKARIYQLNKSLSDIRIYITNAAGVVLFDSQSGRDEGKDYSKWNDINRTLRGEYGARMSYDPNDGPSGSMYVAAPIIKNGLIIGAISVGKPTTSANLFISAAKKSTMLLGLGTFLCVLLIGLLLAIYVTRPIGQLTQYVKRISVGYKDPLPKLPSNELATLGREFESMRAALDGREYIEKYVQTLTHEIKSPLSGIRAAAEILTEQPPEDDRKRFLNNILKESSRIESLVQNLLSLASLQNRNHLENKEYFLIKDLVQEITTNFAVQCEARDILLRSLIHDDIKIKGDRFWISQALSHVLQNALEFSPNHSQITVFGKLEKNKVIVEVEDHGSGIPDFAKGKVVEKFFSLPRLGSNKKSSGLGLALVSEVLKLHQGALQIDSQEGRGTIVKLIFPS